MDEGCVSRMASLFNLESAAVAEVNGEAATSLFLKSVAFMGCRRLVPEGKPFGLALSSIEGDFCDANILLLLCMLAAEVLICNLLL